MVHRSCQPWAGNCLLLDDLTRISRDKSRGKSPRDVIRVGNRGTDQNRVACLTVGSGRFLCQFTPIIQRQSGGNWKLGENTSSGALSARGHKPYENTYGGIYRDNLPLFATAPGGTPSQRWQSSRNSKNLGKSIH